MAVKCKIIKGKEICERPNLFSAGYLGRQPFVEGFSPTSLGVFALMPTDPPNDLKLLMNDFINSQSSVEGGSGNFELLDVFQFYAMDTAANAVINWIGLASTDALLINSPTFDAFDGITGNGVDSHILTNFNPTDDGVKYIQDDAIMGVWCVDNLSAVTGRYLFGLNAAVDVWFGQDTSPSVFFRINDATNTVAESNFFLDNTLYSVQRVDSANHIGIEGTTETSAAIASTGVTSGDITVTARGAGSRLNAEVACFYAGAGIGFDITNFESNLSTFITATAALG